MNNPFHSLRKVLIIFTLILFGGTLGYKVIEDMSWLEAFYMVIITVTTVGFHEVKPLHPDGIAFTIVLILGSFGTFAYGAGLVAQVAIDGRVREYLVTRRMERKVEQLEGHTIVCGLGRNGRQVVSKLDAYGIPVLAIEKDTECIAQCKDLFKNVIIIKGDATEDDLLERVNIEKASSLIAALSSDTDNLFVVISARQLNPGLTIGARANMESTERKLLAAGANYTVSPNLVGGAHLAHSLMNPGVMNFLDHLSVGGSSATNIEEIVIDELPEVFSACDIKDLEIRQQTGCTVIGYIGAHGELVVNPAPDFKVEPHSKLYVLGNDEQIQSFREWFTKKVEH